jgi:hypothetical protein
MLEASARLAELQLQHRHDDGSWSPLLPAHHDPAAHDPERDWVSGRNFVCVACGEEVRVTYGDNQPDTGDTT